MKICVHSMGKVRSNSLFEAIESVGFDVFETHALRYDLIYLQQLQGTQPNARHLQDSLKVKSLMKDKEPIFFIVVLGDPIKRSLLQFFQQAKVKLPDFDGESASVGDLRDMIAKNDFLESPQSWVDIEVREVLGVEFELLKDFEGGTLLGQSIYGPVLFVKSELTATQKSAALSSYLDKKITVKNSREKNSKRVQKLYAKVKRQGLPSEYVDKCLNHPFIKFFYSDKEIGKLKRSWKDKLSAEKPLDPLASSMTDHAWVCVHHMGNVGAEFILDELDRRLDQVVFETKSLNGAKKNLTTIHEKNPRIRHAGDGLALLNYLSEDVAGKFIVIVNNPIVRNLATFLLNNRKTFQDESLEKIGSISKNFEKANPAKSTQVWVSKEILDLFKVNYPDFTDVAPGAAFFKSKNNEVLVIGSDLSDKETSDILSKYLHQSIDFDRTENIHSIKLFDPKIEDVFSQIRDQGVSASYVEDALGQRYLREIYSPAQISDMRVKWEDSIAVRRINKVISVEEFGRELPSWKNDLKQTERIYEAEGGFHHYGARTNIAAASYWAVESSHPKDLRLYGSHETTRKKNYESWKNNKYDKIEPFKFSPNIDVAIHDISVEVDGIPIKNYPFLLGDGCVYYGGAEIDGRDDGYVPGPSEAHCTALSLRTSSSFIRNLELPEEFPIYLSKFETLDTPQHFARHWPHQIRKEDLDVARVRTRIKYKKYEQGMTVHKFIRIPYLDQYPFSPTLIAEDRPWYHAWDKTEPLEVKGFAVYFSPKPPIQQQLENIKIHVLDSAGKPIPGKELAMVNQDAGGNTESFSLKPSFMKGNLTVEAGEYLSASAHLVDGTPAADIGFYILVEIPESKIGDAYGSPLFFSQGCANLEYLQNSYDADRKKFISTPAALAVLRNISQTPLAPWDKELGLTRFPSEKKQADKMYSKASKYIFVN